MCHPQENQLISRKEIILSKPILGAVKKETFSLGIKSTSVASCLNTIFTLCFYKEKQNHTHRDNAKNKEEKRKSES